jgi:hypothetical protein
MVGKAKADRKAKKTGWRKTRRNRTGTGQDRSRKTGRHKSCCAGGMTCMAVGLIY